MPAHQDRYTVLLIVTYTATIINPSSSCQHIVPELRQGKVNLSSERSSGKDLQRELFSPTRSLLTRSSAFDSNLPQQESNRLLRSGSSRQSDRLLQSGSSRQRHTATRKNVPLRKASIRTNAPYGCEQFSWPAGVRSLAVVGNGPLSDQQRAEIEVYDAVLRFNKMDSMNCGEKLTIWMSRYSYEAPDKYHGLDRHGSNCTTADTVKQAFQVWLMDGEEWWLKQALQKHPSLQESGKYIWADGRRWSKRYQSIWRGTMRRRRGHNPIRSSPSSGWLGLAIALDCKPEGVDIHLYGYNWHKGLWSTHRVDQEEVFCRQKAMQGFLTIHETQCKEMRSCTP